MYFASKSLTAAQQNYVAIELEALAVSWAVQKFHHYLYGTSFTLQTDQKPLQAILSKSLVEATPQMQRLLLPTIPYDMAVEYIKGETNFIADCLSRAPVAKVLWHKMTKILSDKYPLLLILHLARLSCSCDLVTCTYTSQ